MLALGWAEVVCQESEVGKESGVGWEVDAGVAGMAGMASWERV